MCICNIEVCAMLRLKLCSLLTFFSHSITKRNSHILLVHTWHVSCPLLGTAMYGDNWRKMGCWERQKERAWYKKSRGPRRAFKLNYYVLSTRWALYPMDLRRELWRTLPFSTCSILRRFRKVLYTASLTQCVYHYSPRSQTNTYELLQQFSFF